MSSGIAIERKHGVWKTIRDSVAHDGLDTTLAVTGRKFATVNALDKSFFDRHNVKTEIRFRVTTSITDLTYTVWALNQNEDARFVCTGVATKGNQTATKKNNSVTDTFYCDQITVTSQRWINPVESTDILGNNEMAVISFDRGSAEKIFVEITAVTGTGSMSVDMTGSGIS